jgi:NSS family neurotransmitter:Na+ symporter
MSQHRDRETFRTRLGFLLIAAGCAIGLGNVWRFPYIAGQYGGAAFVLPYLGFLLFLGLPVLMAELAVGRGSRSGIGRSMDTLEKPGTKWHWAKFPLIAANYILMAFYSVVTGWMLFYFYKMLTDNEFLKGSPDKIASGFGEMLANPSLMIFWMTVAIVVGLGIVSLGLQKGVERVTKKMMLLLFVIMVLLAIRAITLPGATKGIEFYLLPSMERLTQSGKGVGDAIFAAFAHAFFTLSVGIGSMSIFGSYIKRENSLTKEAVSICTLDTVVALVAGLIIIPSCFAFGQSPGQGPGLIFVTLSNVFALMPAGRFCGAAFFLFMSFAALSTLIAVFENIVAFWMDLKGFKRRKVAYWNIVVIFLLSLPCALGFNVLAGFEPFGPGSCVLDLEDFLVSNTLLPAGAIFFVVFCNSRYGWGQDKFFDEMNAGAGAKLPRNRFIKIYFKWVLPALIAILLIQGYMSKFAPELAAKIF